MKARITITIDYDLAPDLEPDEIAPQLKRDVDWIEDILEPHIHSAYRIRIETESH